MKTNLIILQLGIVISLISCSKNATLQNSKSKKFNIKQKEPIAVLNNMEDNDYDGDGILNDLEASEHESYMANLFELNIKNLNTSLNFKLDKSTYHYKQALFAKDSLEEQTSKNYAKIIANLINEDSFEEKINHIDWYPLIKVTNNNPKETYLNSFNLLKSNQFGQLINESSLVLETFIEKNQNIIGPFQESFKIDLINEDLKSYLVESFYEENKLNSILFNREINIDQIILNQKNLYLKLSNFGKDNSSYEKRLETIKSKTYKLVVSDSKNAKIYYLHPSIDPNDFLKKLNIISNTFNYELTNLASFKSKNQKDRIGKTFYLIKKDNKNLKSLNYWQLVREHNGQNQKIDLFDTNHQEISLIYKYTKNFTLNRRNRIEIFNYLNGGSCYIWTRPSDRIYPRKEINVSLAQTYQDLYIISQTGLKTPISRFITHQEKINDDLYLIKIKVNSNNFSIGINQFINPYLQNKCNESRSMFANNQNAVTKDHVGYYANYVNIGRELVNEENTLLDLAIIE